MNLRRNSKYTAEVFTGSLNDIMFFLLLFFLIVSTLASPSVIKLLLPQTKSAQVVSPKTKIILSVSNDKKYYINNKEIPLPHLENELKAATRNVADPLIVLRFDNALTVQDLVNVLQIGTDLKVKMVLATKTLN